MKKPAIFGQELPRDVRRSAPRVIRNPEGRQYVPEDEPGLPLDLHHADRVAVEGERRDAALSGRNGDFGGHEGSM